MILSKLTLTNFGVFFGRHEFLLRPQQLDGEERPIILFGGKNGSGKTTILDALRLCLYGRNALGARVRATDYDTYIRQRFHRSHTEAPVRSASVGLSFDHVHAGVRSVYDAVRSWQIEGAEVREKVSIFKDGQPFQDIAPEHWADFLRDLIPIGLADLFFFDGEQVQALADPAREAEALATAIRGLLNLDLIARLRADLGVYLRRQDTQNRTALEEAAYSAEVIYAEQSERVEELKQDRSQLQSKLDHIDSQIETVRTVLLREGAGFLHRRDNLEQRRAAVERELEHLNNAIRDLAAGLLPFAVTPLWTKRLADRLTLEANAEQARLIDDAEQARAGEISFSLLNPDFQLRTAPKVAPHDWAQIVAAVQKLLLPAENSEAITPRHHLSAHDRDKLLAGVTEATDHLPTQLAALASQLETLESERSALALALAQVPGEDIATPILDEFTRHLEAKGRLDEQLARLDGEIRQHEFRLVQLERERRLATERLAQAGNLSTRIQHAAKAQLVLDDYLTRITDVKLQEMEHAIAHYFNLLWRKHHVIREVKIDPRRYTVELFGQNRTLFPKSDFSAGEKQLYATALLWALRAVSGRALPIIIDTPLGRLDSDHREALLTRFFPNASHQVILLSTDTEIDAAAQDKLRNAVSRTFLLEYDQVSGATSVALGYFTAPQQQEVLA